MLGLAVVGLAAAPAGAQTRILPLGDSITNGGQDHASYRYPLYFDLLAAGFSVDFVGSQTEIYLGGIPNPVDYPDYDTTFDRNHEGYWGQRTDEIEANVQGFAQAAQPDIVLIHLGTNDIGQNGAAGVTAADQNLRDIIGLIRLEVPNVTVLLAQVIPIGAMSGYGANAGQVGPLNAAVSAVAAALDTPQSPVMVVDQNSGFDLNSMMQPDDLHPNLTGEEQMADTWLAALTPLLPPGNPLPNVTLTAPAPGSVGFAPASFALAADASDPNGSVVEVRFRVDGQLLGADATAPYSFDWSGVPVGSYTLTAEAEDDQGATRTSEPVAVTVLPPGSPVPVAIVNPSFEDPPLPDIATEENSALIPGWDFSGTASTFTGIFNPPAGSYPEAAGQGTPIGADGAQAAFLFNNGGPAESVSAEQLLGETLEAGRSYTLRVAIGRFDPGQPYVPSTYGGYTIELRAGGTVIASDTDSVDPDPLTFTDAIAIAPADAIPPALIGQPLSIRLDISSDTAARSTHFDDVRLEWTATTVPALGVAARLTAVAALLLAAWRVRRRR